MRLSSNKIGRSNAAARHAHEPAIQLPERLEVVHVIETDDAIGIECYWHQQFANRRLNGEWFASTKADVGKLPVEHESYVAVDLALPMMLAHDVLAAPTVKSAGQRPSRCGPRCSPVHVRSA